VLRNLLDNAMRHTDEGAITVTCSVEGDSLVIEVADTGEGIPERDIPYVFERFYRADAARARDTGGSGIGLAVSRRIVEDHGGKVFARNRASGGAIVGFSLPLAGRDA
jgi:signal transduction histidine kinase